MNLMNLMNLMNPMNLAPRCLAKTRRATLCQSPAIRGKKRCRLHGGAKGSGAPKGNKNALKHGEYSAKTIANKKRRYKRFLKKLQALPEENVFFWRGRYWII